MKYSPSGYQIVNFKLSDLGVTEESTFPLVVNKEDIKNESLLTLMKLKKENRLHSKPILAQWNDDVLGIVQNPITKFASTEGDIVECGSTSTNLSLQISNDSITVNYSEI